METQKTISPDYTSYPAALAPFVRENSLVVRSPGRINLIGEHTDYNDGFVLPAAIDKAAYFAITPAEGDFIKLHSADFHEDYKTTIHELRKSEKNSWPNYLLGVADQFKKAGVTLSGFEGTITGEIPLGAGLSSSAAVECAIAFALNELLQTRFSKLQLVKMAQRAENDFVGVRCGIMDQFASMFGLRDHVIRLDCRSLDYEYEPFRMEGIRMVLLDSGVKHSLASSEYNVRRQQCEEGVSIIQKKYAEVQSLRDVTQTMLDELLLPVVPLIYRRCKYVVEENLRLLAACEDLKKGDMKSFGNKMFDTHHGLSRDYEVSCSELDFLVDAVQNNPSVLGSRMMGGGFGGCTINIVNEGAVEELIQSVGEMYFQSFRKELKAYVVKIEDGTSLVRHIG